MRQRLFFFLLWLSMVGAASAQSAPAGAQSPDSLMASHIRVWTHYADRPSPDVFLHLDKTLYTPNEMILFTAYLLQKGVDTSEQHTLYVVLINLATQKVVVSDRFFMRSGISTGSLMVPDSVDNGQYLLEAYTNGMEYDDPRQYFRQQVGIRSRTMSPFSLAVSQEATGADRAAPDSIRLTCRLTTDYGGLASGGLCTYTIYGDGRLCAQGKKTADAFGEIHIVLPQTDTLAGAVILRMDVKRGDKTGHFWTPLSIKPRQVLVTYYPEGGALVDGQPTRIGVEVRTGSGMGLAVQGFLQEDGKDLASFRTDEYGLGSFTCTVYKGRPYSVSVKGIPAGDHLCATFPDILSDGYTLHIPAGVVRDSLALQIQAPDSGSHCELLIYSDREILYAARIGLATGGRTLTLPVKGWASGIAEVALFAEDGSPAAERAIYIPPGGISVSIQTDSSMYHTRSKVRLHIRVTGDDGNGVSGVFSLASVLATRISTTNYQDIERHAVFDRYLPSAHAPLPPWNYFDNDTSVDVLLLTRFWARNLLNEDTTKSPEIQPGEDDFGYVLHDGKKLKKPVPLILVGSTLYNFTTDSSGHFQIPYKALIAGPGTNPIVSVVNTTDQDDYTVVLRNRYDTLNKQLAAAWYDPGQWMSDTTIRDEEQPGTPTFNAIKSMKSVVIKARDEDWNSGMYPLFNGSCNDFVCMYGILNCPNHPGCCRVPSEGEVVSVPGRGREIYHSHCVDRSSAFLGRVPAIHLASPLYKSDSASFSPTEPALLSTIYWGPVVVTDQKGEATVSFYTDDVKGRFVIWIQGISAEGVFSGKQAFRVIE